MHKRKLDSDDIATILAGLRMFQRKYEDVNAEGIRADWPDFFNKPISPLSSEDIDELCEQLNFGEVRL